MVYQTKSVSSTGNLIVHGTKEAVDRLVSAATHHQDLIRNPTDEMVNDKRLIAENGVKIKIGPVILTAYISNFQRNNDTGLVMELKSFPPVTGVFSFSEEAEIKS